MELLSSIIKSFDKFGDTVNFNIKNGSPVYRTWPGTVISLIIYSLILIYGGQKFLIMWSFDDTKYEKNIKWESVSIDSVFTADDIDFQVAFSIVMGDANF